jgi:hypothetical protein
MQVHTSGDVEEYAASVEAFLRADPCSRNVLLTVIDLLRAAPWTYPVTPSFWWITDSGSVVGAASWTPPHNLLVSSLPTETAEDLATAATHRATELGLRLRGVSGPADSARAVAAALSVAGGDSIERERPILLNELVSLVEVPVPPGSRRPGRAEDVPLVAEWLEAFSAEIEHALNRSRASTPAVLGRLITKCGWPGISAPIMTASARFACSLVRFLTNKATS